MPSIVPPRTDTQDQNTVLEELDWDPPCEYPEHPWAGAGHATLVISLGPSPCGCKPYRTVLHCAGCFHRWTSTWNICQSCSARFRAIAAIVRVERI